jgi:hypothetical protein
VQVSLGTAQDAPAFPHRLQTSDVLSDLFGSANRCSSNAFPARSRRGDKAQNMAALVAGVHAPCSRSPRLVATLVIILFVFLVFLVLLAVVRVIGRQFANCRSLTTSQSFLLLLLLLLIFAVRWRHHACCGRLASELRASHSCCDILNVAIVRRI